uniref:hypothetical protein n=1 Tax=Paractinoplanes polyasparticus TaxID=2856853 RepID=UPI001C848799|nr:hypothetical protein [Actinoplanes polyasparticus]
MLTGPDRLVKASDGVLAGSDVLLPDEGRPLTGPDGLFQDAGGPLTELGAPLTGPGACAPVPCCGTPKAPSALNGLRSSSEPFRSGEPLLPAFPRPEVFSPRVLCSLVGPNPSHVPRDPSSPNGLRPPLRAERSPPNAPL